MPVDLFGQMAPIEAVSAAVPGLPIIEDAAQSIGARRMIDGEWRMAGEVATIGTFSFFPSKNLGGYGDGGMMVTQDDALAERLCAGCACMAARSSTIHDEVGYNSRLDALQAAVLSAEAAASRRLERQAARECRVLRRGLRATSRSVRDARTSARRTSRSSTSTRFACRPARRAAGHS